MLRVAGHDRRPRVCFGRRVVADRPATAVGLDERALQRDAVADVGRAPPAPGAGARPSRSCEFERPHVRLAVGGEALEQLAPGRPVPGRRGVLPRPSASSSIRRPVRRRLPASAAAGRPSGAARQKRVHAQTSLRCHKGQPFMRADEVLDGSCLAAVGEGGLERVAAEAARAGARRAGRTVVMASAATSRAGSRADEADGRERGAHAAALERRARPRAGRRRAARGPRACRRRRRAAAASSSRGACAELARRAAPARARRRARARARSERRRRAARRRTAAARRRRRSPPAARPRPPRRRRRASRAGYDYHQTVESRFSISSTGRV